MSNVYFIGAGEAGPVKIGTAIDVAARLKELQCGNHELLTVLRVMPGTLAVELWLHRHFRSQRIRGEWFSFHADMMTVEPPTVIARCALDSCASRIIDLFGGTRAAAQILALPASTVQSWKDSGLIPARHQNFVLTRARERGLPLEPADSFEPPAEAAES